MLSLKNKQVSQLEFSVMHLGMEDLLKMQFRILINIVYLPQFP